MSNTSTSWGHLPPEIRNEVVRILPGLGGTCSQLATVSREWQPIIEALNFAEISLTVPSLSDPYSRAILFRKRNQIRCIWFRVELEQYTCHLCEPEYEPDWQLGEDDNMFISEALHRLFSTLSSWEPRGDLILDISVYSPSDMQHCFKYLNFHPDTYLGECPTPQQGILIDDPAQNWVGGHQRVAPNKHAIAKTFDRIMAEGPFEDEEVEMQW